MTTVNHLLNERALERNLRPSTLRSYRTLLGRLELLDQDVSDVRREDVVDKLFELSINTRRSTVIALRSVLGWDLRVPRGTPRRYEHLDETTMRLALMQSPHEVRGLLMAYAGLRSGEACAITGRDVQGDRLTVDKQVCEGTNKIGPVKSVEGSVVIPHWLAERLRSLEATERPASVRESLRRAGAKVGISLNPHRLRHWYATELLTRGVPLVTVSRAMRHSDLKTTAVYLQIDDGKAIHDVFG